MRTHPVFGLQRNRRRRRRRPGNPPLAVLAPSHALDGGDASFHLTPMTRRQLASGGRAPHRGLLECFATSLEEETGTSS